MATLRQFTTTRLGDSQSLVGDLSNIIVGVRRDVEVAASALASESGGGGFGKDEALIRLTWRGDVAITRPTHLCKLTNISQLGTIIMATNFMNDINMTRVANASAAGQTTITSDVIDMSGYDVASFIAILGDVTDTAELTLTVQHGDADDGSDAVETTIAASFTATATSADNGMLVVENIRPEKRYLRVTLHRGVANAAAYAIVALRADPSEAPVLQDGVLASDVGLHAEDA